MANLLERSSVVLTPTAYNNGEALCIKPDDGSGDFDFSRNSAATRVNAQGLVENVQILSSNLVQNGDFSEEGVQEVSNGSFSQEGVQLVTNGSFDTDSDWNKNSNWSIGGNVANCDGTSNGDINQGTTLATIGKSYKISYEVVSISQGEFFFKFGGVNGTLRNSIGVYTETIQAINTNRIALDSSNNAIGSIDNVSVREVGQDWTLGTGWSIGEDKAVYDGSSYSGISQIIPNLTGKILKVQFDIVDYTSGTIRISPSNKQSGSDIRYSNNGTYVEYYTSAQDRLDLQPQLFNGSITNISVKEVGMDWNLGDSWEIGSSKATRTTSIDWGLDQAISSAVNGRTYRVTTEIKDYTSGILRLALGSGGTVNAIGTDLGVYVNDFVWDGTSGSIIRYQGSFVGSVTNISVIEISTDTNLPRISYENFSYQDALGSEEVVNGTFDSDLSGWNNSNNYWQWTSQGAYFPLTTTHNPLSQVITNDASAVLKFTFTLTIVQGTANVYYQDLNNASAAQQFTQSGTYTIYTVPVKANTSINFSRYGGINTEFYIDNVSVKEYLGQEVVPNSGCGSWLFEPQSTNLIPYSSDFSSGNWFEYGETSATIDAAQSNPSGANGSYKIEGLSGLGRFGISSISVTPSTDYTFSFYAKNINATLLKVFLELSNSPSFYTYTSEVNTSDWSRVSINFTTGASVTSMQLQIIRDLPIGESVYIWGAMLEQNSYSTSYIPTSGSTVTRNQDVCTNGGSLATINSTEGVLYFEAKSDNLNVGSISINDGTISNRITARFRSDLSKIQLSISGSTDDFNLNSDTITLSDYNKIAIVYNNGDYYFFINGVKGNVESRGTFSANTFTQLDFNRGGGGEVFFGKTKALAVFPYLSDQELTELTTI